MIKRTITSIFLTISLFGCVTYQDPRSPEQQKADFDSASSQLAGTYDVIESRLDDHRGYVSVIASKTPGGFNIVLIGPKDERTTLNGESCKGWGKKSASIMCDAASPRSYFVLDKIEKDFTVKDGAVISSFSPMVIPSGNYRFEIADRGGRSHYYTLAKK